MSTETEPSVEGATAARATSRNERHTQVRNSLHEFGRSVAVAQSKGNRPLGKGPPSHSKQSSTERSHGRAAIPLVTKAHKDKEKLVKKGLIVERRKQTEAAPREVAELTVDGTGSPKNGKKLVRDTSTQTEGVFMAEVAKEQKKPGQEEGQNQGEWSTTEQATAESGGEGQWPTTIGTSEDAEIQIGLATTGSEPSEVDRPATKKPQKHVRWHTPSQEPAFDESSVWAESSIIEAPASEAEWPLTKEASAQTAISSDVMAPTQGAHQVGEASSGKDERPTEHKASSAEPSVVNTGVPEAGGTSTTNRPPEQEELVVKSGSSLTQEHSPPIEGSLSSHGRSSIVARGFPIQESMLTTEVLPEHERYPMIGVSQGEDAESVIGTCSTYSSTIIALSRQERSSNTGRLPAQGQYVLDAEALREEKTPFEGNSPRRLPMVVKDMSTVGQSPMEEQGRRTKRLLDQNLPLETLDKAEGLDEGPIPIDLPTWHIDISHPPANGTEVQIARRVRRRVPILRSLSLTYAKWSRKDAEELLRLRDFKVETWKNIYNRFTRFAPKEVRFRYMIEKKTRTWLAGFVVAQGYRQEMSPRGNRATADAGVDFGERDKGVSDLGDRTEEWFSRPALSTAEVSFSLLSW